MASLDGNLNFSMTWFDEVLEDCSDELELGDDKELTEEVRAGICQSRIGTSDDFLMEAHM